MSEAKAIREARSALGMGRDTFARLIGLDTDVLEALEAGRNPPNAEIAEIIDELALVLGIEADELLYDGAAGRATTVLLRSFATTSAFQGLVDERLHYVLGELVRDARRKAWLRRMLQRPKEHGLGAMTPRPIRAEASVPFGADQLAEELRQDLGLGVEPIDDMLDLLRNRLAVDVRFTTPETLWAQIEGASLREPHPTILVNLIGGPSAWWRTRMTLAHELCHLLFDGSWLGPGGNGALIFSPAPRRDAGPSLPAAPVATFASSSAPTRSPPTSWHRLAACASFSGPIRNAPR